MIPKLSMNKTYQYTLPGYLQVYVFSSAEVFRDNPMVIHRLKQGEISLIDVWNEETDIVVRMTHTHEHDGSYLDGKFDGYPAPFEKLYMFIPGTTYLRLYPKLQMCQFAIGIY